MCILKPTENKFIHSPIPPDDPLEEVYSPSTKPQS